VGEFWRTSDSESYYRPLGTLPTYLTGDYVYEVPGGTFHLANGSRLISATGPITPGTFARLRWHFKAASSAVATDGHYKMWIDDALYYSAVNKNFYAKNVAPLTNADLKNGYLMGAMNAGYTGQTDFHIDNFKLYDADPGWV
jgi:hypothetical protein